MAADDTFDPRERAAEKAKSREQDERDLASGAKTREQLRAENTVIVLRNAKMNLGKAKRLS